MEDAFEALQSKDEDEEPATLGKRNSLGKRIWIMKKKALERVDKI